MYTFVTMPAKKEGALAAARAQIVSNRALHLNAMAAGIPPWIQSRPMVPKTWSPFLPGPCPPAHQQSNRMDVDDADGEKGQSKKGKKQKREEEADMQWLGDKV